MKLKFTVVSVITQQNGTICMILKNNTISEESDTAKKSEVVDMFNPQQMMQTVMQTTMQVQQKMMGIEPNLSRMVITQKDFNELRLTIGDEVEFQVETDRL